MNATGLETVSIAPPSLDNLPSEGLLATEDTQDDAELLIGLGRATAKGQLVAYTNLDGAVCILKEHIPEEFTDEQAGRDGLAAVIEITTAPRQGAGYQFGFLDVAGWNTYVDINLQGGVLSKELSGQGQLDMADYVISDHLGEINNFDQSEIVALANDLPTDC